MAVPKKKVSKARRDKRRSNVWKLDMPGMVKCPKCGEYNLAPQSMQSLRFLRWKAGHQRRLTICQADSTSCRRFSLYERSQLRRELR